MIRCLVCARASRHDPDFCRLIVLGQSKELDRVKRRHCSLHFRLSDTVHADPWGVASCDIEGFRARVLRPMPDVLAMQEHVVSLLSLRGALPLAPLGSQILVTMTFLGWSKWNV